MREFVVSVGHEDSVKAPFWQMRVVWVTVNNVDIPLMVQKCSDPQKC